MTGAGGLFVVVGLPLLTALALIAIGWSERRFGMAQGPGFFQRNGLAVGLYLIIAVGFWAFFVIVLPQLAMVDMSVRPKLPPSQMGGPKDVYTLENYRYFLFGSTTSTASWNWSASRRTISHPPGAARSAWSRRW